MNKKIILVLIVMIIATGGTWWLMQKNKLNLSFGSYDRNLDSLFLNLQFGMTRQVFFDACWKLNKEGLVMQGANNLSVQHKIESELGMPVHMNFYPEFSEDRLYQMPVMYHYLDWAPWNKQFYSDTLIVRVVEKLESDFKVKFTKKETTDGRPAYYNYTGPRKILVTIKDEQYVKVLMENEKYK